MFDHRTYSPKAGDVVYNERGQYRKVLAVERVTRGTENAPRVPLYTASTLRYCPRSL